MAVHKLAVAVTYTGEVLIEADSFEEAAEMFTDGVSSWLSTDDGDLDYWGTDIENLS